ncbi:MAG TPA: DNA-formamidopyrimidine glycosylase family protein [Acidimicrobiales bacterium]|nr:DNA-formamidopyrimidine glycosylase family protein [Acidimicrobiales bacterium]
MPEGHTIHRLARDQRRDLAGHALAASSPQGRFAEGAALIDGAVLVDTEAWGKHLFHHYDTGDVLHVHLGLIGRFVRRRTPPPDPVGLVRLRLVGPERTWDLSGPIVCSIVTPDHLEHVVAKLGPDPLRADADPDRFVAALGRRKIPIGAALLDQTVIAGIGNVYRAEMCFLAGIHPATPSNEVDEATARRLWDLAVELLALGVRRNRIITIDPAELDVPVTRLRRGDSTYVYHRDTCRRCGTPLEVADIGGRRCWSCPAEQPRARRRRAAGSARRAAR